MALSKGQRIGMWAVLVLMIVGTLASFFGMILTANSTQDQNAQYQEQLKQFEEQQKQADAMAIKRSEASKPFDPAYAAEAFRADDVTEVQKTDLVEGTGAVAEKDKNVTFSYFGWNAEGKIFDSSLQEGKANEPFTANVTETEMIAGMIDGIQGMKVGGVRKIAIPGDKAYGENRQSPLIEANAPLMFIIRLDAVK